MTCISVPRLRGESMVHCLVATACAALLSACATMPAGGATTPAGSATAAAGPTTVQGAVTPASSGPAAATRPSASAAGAPAPAPAVPGAPRPFAEVIKDAKPIHASANGIVNSHQGFDSAGKVIDPEKAKETVRQLGEKLKEIKDAMGGTGKALHDAIQAFREANPRSTQTP